MPYVSFILGLTLMAYGQFNCFHPESNRHLAQSFIIGVCGVAIAVFSTIIGNLP